jgi:phospholipid transport system substrate-binding protein
VGQSPVEVIWLVSDGSGQPRIFNILIEGIDLRSTEGQEMRSILDANGGSIDALIAVLNAS